MAFMDAVVAGWTADLFIGPRSVPGTGPCVPSAQPRYHVRTHG